MNSTLLRPALIASIAVPWLVALNVPPSPTLLNQIAAWGAWALVANYAGRAAQVSAAQAARSAGALLVALVLAAFAAGLGPLAGSLPAGMGWSGLGTLLAASAVCVLGAAIARHRVALGAWTAGLGAGAILSAVIGVMQVFAPEAIDGEWLARAGSAGRAVGNVRQPNHLASLLLMGAVALVPLADWASPRRHAVVAATGLLAMALLMFGVMLTGSRTGMIGVAALALWGMTDRRLGRVSRGLLLAAPVFFALSWWLTSLWSAAQAGPAIGAAQRVGASELTTGRFSTWSNALSLIAQQPLSGVGFGEFNVAWTLTPFAQRWPEFFDHTHNLLLQMLVELGVVVGGLVILLLLWALWQAGRRAWAVDADLGPALRASFVMVLLMGVHSFLEYPLWYAHFLFPTAFAWGLCLGAERNASPPTQPYRWPLAIAVLLALGAGAMAWDYRRVSAIFAPSEQDERTLVERIHDGQRSWFFAHHADYARLTALEEVAPPSTAEFRRATHYLLDTRLLTAWARAYAREGDVERARWIADRLRELKQPSAEPFFKACTDPAVTAKPFQCTPASTVFDWREFK
jgi:O-antigen ligase